MSIFDEDEQEKSLDDNVILKHFLKKYVEPELDKLSKKYSVQQYALGIYLPEDFLHDMVQSVIDDCNKNNISNCVVPVAGILQRSNLDQFYITLLKNDYSVVILENFDKVPDVAPFTGGNKVPCDRINTIG